MIVGGGMVPGLHARYYTCIDNLLWAIILEQTLEKFKLRISKDKKNLEYDYSPNKKKTGITTLLNEIKKTGIELTDVQTKQSNLEQIFVEILKND